MVQRIPKGTPPEEWEPELVSELILAAMKNLPPALPPHLIDVADTPLSMWPDRLANPGKLCTHARTHTHTHMHTHMHTLSPSLSRTLCIKCDVSAAAVCNHALGLLQVYMCLHAHMHTHTCTRIM